VNVPKNLCFKIEARSSLFRLTQALLETSFGEAGYRGRLTFMLLPILDTKIALGVRFAQLCFSKLSGESHYEEQQETSYQGGRIV
jgi:deoxycytidine triphosphate deaminase